jgi:ribosome-associated heat shock protein Hsp15
VSGDERQRIDRWLWNARVVRTRTDAAALVVAGHVRVNGNRMVAPGRDVKCGDVVTVALDGRVRVLKVVGMTERRGNAAAASLIFEELSGGAGKTPAQGLASQFPSSHAPSSHAPSSRIPPRSRGGRRHRTEND